MQNTPIVDENDVPGPVSARAGGNTVAPEGLPPKDAPAADQAKRAGRHVVELDGVRGFALSMMLANHLLEAPPADVRGIAMLPGFVRTIIHHGFLSIDLFFALSGFLITSNLLRAKPLGTKQYFAIFYKRRALRILPLYFLVLILIAIAVGPSYLPFLGLGALLSANLGSLFHIAVPPPAGPFWSLGVEEQFYLVWPWLVLLLPRRGLIVATLCIVFVEPILRFTIPGDLSYTWYHSDGLAIGSLLAVLYSRWNGEARLVWATVGVLVAAFIAVTVGTIPFGGFHSGPIAGAERITQASLLSGALISLAVGCSGAPWLAFFRTRIAVLTATYSYCIYLIHRPLIDIYQFLAPRLVPASVNFSSTEQTVARAVFVLAFAYGIGALSWKYFESPILKIGRSR